MRDDERESLYDSSQNDRERLMASTDRLEKSSDKIRYAIDTLSETESTALEITSELARNREKIEGVHSRVRAVSGLTDHARRVIHGMSKRETQQKICFWVIGLVLCGGFGSVIYIAFK